MKVAVYRCDRCGHQIPDDEKPFKFTLFKEKKLDAAGSLETWNYVSDLCQECISVLANQMMIWIDKNCNDEMFKGSLINTVKARTE